MSTHETVIDFGCGTGRATKKFVDMGFSAVGVDFVNAVQGDVPFIHACLWAMPDMSADWGFCADVMEHIPPEKVSDVLHQIRRRTTKGCFFQISLTKDSFGDRIGERLHLTVQPADWWSEQLNKHWGRVKVTQRGTTAIAICRPTNLR